MRKKVIFELLLLISLISLFVIPVILAQDFGPFSPFTNVYQTQQEYNPYGSPISPFSVFSGTTTLTQILYSDWFSGLLSFLIFFTVYLFLLRNFFKEVAVILALLLAIASAAGILIFYGPFIPLVGIWGVVILAAGALFGLFRNFRGYGKHLPITLLLIAIAWFLFRSYICGLTWIPYQFCPVMDAVAALIVIIAGLYLLYRLARYLFNLLRGSGGSTGGISGGGGGNMKCVLTIAINGNGNTDPSPGSRKYNQGSNVKITARPGSGQILDHWELNRNNLGNSPKIKIHMNQDNYLTAFFKGVSGGSGSGGGAIQNKRAVYDLQQKYRDYYMRIWNRGLTSHQRERILQAMKIIESQLNSQRADLPKGASKKPRQIYHDLKRSKLI